MDRKIALVASLGLLMGCTREGVVVPAESLPAFAESQAVTYTRTRDGQRVIEEGPIRWVVVHSWPPATSHAVASSTEDFRSPFQARLAGDQLQVSDDEQKAAHALRDIQQVDLYFDARAGASPSMAMRIAGIVLTSLGSACLVAGLALEGAVAHSSGAAAGLAGVPPVAVSTLFAGIGVPLWVAGGPEHPVAPAVSPLLTPKVYGATLGWMF